MIDWKEEQETVEKYWSLRAEGFIIVKKPNAFELSYDRIIDGYDVRTTHRSINLDCLKKLANEEWDVVKTKRLDQ